MKRFALATALLLSIVSISNADELRFLSKKDASKAVKFLHKQTQLYLFCGCCTTSDKELITFVSARIKDDGQKMFEVTMTYRNAKGELKQKEVDLANVWVKEKKRAATVGQELELPHDLCEPLGAVSWDKKK